MGTPSAPFLDFAAEVKRRLDVPVMHAARIADVATARHAVREGLLDLVGMTRAQIADPHLVAKVAAGTEDRIRPCVGASYCLDAIYDSGDAKCVHNPATGRELTLPHTIAPAADRKKAVVVGGGPAGLEAARVLGERGHEVVLFEAADLPGGQLRLAAANPRRRDLLGIVDWRVAECKRARRRPALRGARRSARTSSRNTPTSSSSPPAACPTPPSSPRAPTVVSDTWDVLSGALRPRGRVLVYDDNGAYPALDAVEVLARRGVPVEYVTPERTLAPDVGSMNAPAYLQVFAEHGVTSTLAHRLRVRRAAPRTGGWPRRCAASTPRTRRERVVDHVVVEHGTLPNDDLYRELLPGLEQPRRGRTTGRCWRPHRSGSYAIPRGRYQLFRIGDAVTSRNIHAAVLDALRLCLPM